LYEEVERPACLYTENSYFEERENIFVEALRPTNNRSLEKLGKGRKVEEEIFN